MITLIIRRLLQSLVVLIIVTIIVFFVMRLLPGDPILMIVTQTEQQELTMEMIEELRHKHGLDRSILVQYFDWMKGVIRGDLGKSILQDTSVSEEIIRRIPITAHLGVLAFIIGIIIGIPVGVISAVRRGRGIDITITILSNIGITMPVFWLGILLIYFFGIYLGWLPVMGYTSPFDDLWMSIKQTIMPVICLAFFPIASTVRQTRSSMLEVMQQEYIRTAWSKGLEESIVIIRHALKNGLMPVITLSGMGIPMILGGSVLVETVFNIPGIGRLATSAVINQDYPYVQGVVLLVSVAVLLSNLLVELIYGWIDPRVRYE